MIFITFSAINVIFVNRNKKMSLRTKKLKVKIAMIIVGLVVEWSNSHLSLIKMRYPKSY